MCQWLKVSKSGYYEWLNKEETFTDKYHKKLATAVRKSFKASDGTYGYRRVHADLIAWGYACCDQTVRHIMGELELVACQPKPYTRTTIPDQDTSTIPDLINRDFTADRPGIKLFGDITYTRTWQGFVYTATVLDANTKECVGYACAENMRTELVIEALDMAIRNQRVQPGAIFHSDRGSQYTSSEYSHHLKKHHIKQSVGRTGICYDNAWAESFNAALKLERVNRTQYPTRKRAIDDIKQYITVRYNTLRRHSSLGYKTPAQHRQQYYKLAA
jgi:putative transposase